MVTEKRDLLVHFDEQTQKLVLYSVRTGDTAAIRTKEFDEVCPEVSHFKGMPPEEAEMKLGGMVFSVLDPGAIHEIGVREYEAQADAAHDQFVAEPEELAAITCGMLTSETGMAPGIGLA